MKNKFLYILISVGLLFSACESWLEINPEDKGVILESDALNTKQDVTELLNAAYDVVNGFYGGRFQRTSELLGDNVVLRDGITDEMVNIYKRYTTGYFTDNESYDQAYICILRSNLILESLDKVSGLSAAETTQMAAEAKFLRGIAHFAVARLFAQPYGYTPNNDHAGIVIKTNSKVELLPRNTVAEVYSQIILDLTDAETDLPESNSNFAYATSWAAKVALAQVYFQMHDYEKAYNKANDVINNGPFTFITDLEEAIPGSTEDIFRLVSSQTTGKRVGGDFGVFRSDGTNIPNIRIAPDVYKNIIKAGAGDLRAAAWYQVFNAGADNEYVALTKFNTEYATVPVLRLTELKLLRAEAAILKSSPDKATAIQDVNDIRERAYASASKNLLETATNEAVLNAARTERRLELMGEGYHLHDLKRRGSAGEDIVIRGVDWDYVGLVIQFAAAEANEVFVPNPEPN
ncbi:RagB/SusD family nutrient uptake outer membrane protein [Maribellus sp. CM-23]|uniref:RagB/SusD family nutrient uptake outer membrane protein n=1 Tax=Maribellus sp. CM-23 TaxID=2781026 RepID=UPI001F3752C0|nr:RagB/SusD family nutrient uptake outer membrane protein [Maribellus sp. CM-23]MCE4566773.1 RagB/SusD family nutrient uptake outer membrane protein [Maribellus sp. CM-23]